MSLPETHATLIKQRQLQCTLACSCTIVTGLFEVTGTCTYSYVGPHSLFQLSFAPFFRLFIESDIAYPFVTFHALLLCRHHPFTSFRI